MGSIKKYDKHGIKIKFSIKYSYSKTFLMFLVAILVSKKDNLWNKEHTAHNFEPLIYEQE